MTIREYFETLFSAASLEELNTIYEIQDTIYAMYEDDYNAFVSWANEHDIDLDVMDEQLDVSVLTTWIWDACGE